MMNPFAIDKMLMAAGEVAGESRFVLVGSAAVIARRPDVPVTMAMSVEIDISDLGQGSMDEKIELLRGRLRRSLPE